MMSGVNAASTDNYITVRIDSTTTSGELIKVTDIPGGEYEGLERPPSGVPLYVPRSQAYYWTKEWQAGEREAQREIDEGRARRFDNPRDAIRWLESGNEA